MARLHNAEIEVVTDKNRGDAIISFRRKGGKNIIDADDNGRMIQSSWYGVDDYGKWKGNPWPWNPVQGGKWDEQRGVLAKRHGSNLTTLTSLGGADWSTGWPGGFQMTTKLNIRGRCLHRTSELLVRNSLLHGTYPRHQEQPACFLLPKYSTVITADPSGNGVLETPLDDLSNGNQYGPIHGGWVGLVDGSSYGLYIRTDCKEWTGYTVGGRLSCSYIAPIRTMQVTHEQSYESVMTVGHHQESVDAIMKFRIK